MGGRVISALLLTGVGASLAIYGIRVFQTWHGHLYSQRAPTPSSTQQERRLSLNTNVIISAEKNDMSPKLASLVKSSHLYISERIKSEVKDSKSKAFMRESVDFIPQSAQATTVVNKIQGNVKKTTTPVEFQFVGNEHKDIGAFLDAVDT